MPLTSERVPAKSTAKARMSSYKQRREAGLTELSQLHVSLCEMMVYGTDSSKAKYLKKPINEPLSLEDAADVLGIRRRNARQVFGTPKFQALYAKLVGAMRSGAHAKMVRNMIDIANNPGERKAADRSVQLKAAKAVLGEQDQALNVNVAVQNTVEGPRLGYVYAPCDRPAKPVTIDATPVRVIDRRPDSVIAREERERRELATLAAEREAERERMDAAQILRPPGWRRQAL
jgi:hypothetical protein